MDRRALSRTGALRIAGARFTPDDAPHRPLLRDLLVAHLPPLQARLRTRAVDDLVRRILLVERHPIPLIEEPAIVQIAHVALRVQQVIQQLEAEERALVRDHRAFATHYAEARDDAQRRRVLVEYLAEHVRDPAQRREDIAALRRWFGPDTVRERHHRDVLAGAVLIELGLLYLAGAVPAVASDDTPDRDDALARLREARLGDFCATRLVGARRWQVRWAAGQAAIAVAEHLPYQRPIAEAGGPDPHELVRGVARHRDEHPWVQAAAIEAVVVTQPEAGRKLLAARLLHPGGELDHFVRKLALGVAARRLAPEHHAALLADLVVARDPSEHVRLGLADAVTALAWERARPLLAHLAGDPSPKVRARVAIAAARVAAATPAATRAAAELVLALTRDSHPLTLQIACEELAALASALAPVAPALLTELAPAWLDAVARLIADDTTPPRVVEIAAAAAERIDRERDPARRELTHELSLALAGIPPGGRGQLDLAAVPAARDERLLGRVLADLSRDDWGVSASARRGRLLLWRGDRLRRRAWRLVHELRHPLPNKRQAWVHTVGREARGDLRAHPGALDEATATAVPGERVTVDSEGSWARHLPLVDDVLDLPVLRPRPLRVVSSLGTTTLAPPPGLARRLRNRLLVTWRYRALAGLRLSSLSAYRDRNRRRYVEELERYGIDVSFEPHAAASPTALQLFAIGPFAAASQWLSENRTYFLSPTQNSQTALVAFGGALAGLFFLRGWHKRRLIDRARGSIPLTIGGWGTRGKSGTERLKAGLLDGLGYEVFVKTTGCEAMFIHSAPLQQPTEIFIYRPYDKSTIWEQMAMLLLGSRLGTEAFLWECMALNPKYVHLLQHDWMNDDLVTLTNCYPDHEDIQGPAGADVARVITEFIPTRGTLVTSETSYLPLFRQVCAARGTTMHAVGERDAELIADDVLELFPYREHPRNIALVTRVATELGIDPDLAQLTMAQGVVPDLGVLKAYPTVRVRGRRLTFVSGNSANERTGFINNWRRMQLDQLDVEHEPARLVVTLVNNRADRIARSEVFARIVVRDAAADRHVLIGTNLKGLRGFLDRAVDDYLRELSLIEPAELVAGEVPAVIAARVQQALGNLRLPAPTAEALLRRLAVWAAAVDHALDDAARPRLTALLAARLAPEANPPVDLAVARRAVAADRELQQALRAALVPCAAPADDDTPETIEPATAAEVLDHLAAELARLQVRAALEARLRALFARPDEAARRAFLAEFAAAYRALFLAQVHVVEDAGATGDQILDRCARLCPPGTDVTLVGTQNIKGTGLDVVYRALAIDRVARALRDQQSPREDRRLAALLDLESFEDHGLVDAGLARALLARPSPHRLSADETATRARIAAKVDAIWRQRKAALVDQRGAGLVDRVAAWGEGVLDWVDSIHRTHTSRRILSDLVHHRISHARAALEQRRLVTRTKGGWLLKRLRGRP